MIVYRIELRESKGDVYATKVIGPSRKHPMLRNGDLHMGDGFVGWSTTMGMYYTIKDNASEVMPPEDFDYYELVTIVAVDMELGQ